MRTVQRVLEEEFATDHRELTRGFSQLLDLLKSRSDEDARNLADHIDQVAGPHIEFEETVLYPVVAQAEGHDFATGLYSEHQTALEAISSLVSRAEDVPIDEETRKRLIDQVQTGLDHAVSCGSLLSHLTALDEGTHETFLKKLRSCRESGVRWSERRSQHA